MASTFKNIVIVATLAIAFLASITLASAVPAMDGAALDMTHALVTRNDSAANLCPPGQSPEQAGW